MMKKIFSPAKVVWKNVKKIDTKKIYLKHISSTIPDCLNVKKIANFVKSGKLALAIDRKSILLKEAMDILIPEYVYNCLGLTRDEFKSKLNTTNDN